MKNFMAGGLAAVAVMGVTFVAAAALVVVSHKFTASNAFTNSSVSTPEPTQSISTPPAKVSTTVRSAPTTTSTPTKIEPARKTVLTTVFWVGEGSTAENGYISNAQSYWDEYWGESFGGIDEPESRCGYMPCTFTPKENPFYIALPYTEFTETGTSLKASAKKIPWYGKDDLPLLKNRWVEVAYKGKTCYGQWQDVGPFYEDDFDYVFGDAEPQNTFGVGAGLDISPALWDCLGMQDNDLTSWQFVDAKEVPEGPWKKTITTSGVSWLSHEF